jgi:hypothetical protein
VWSLFLFVVVVCLFFVFHEIYIHVHVLQRKLSSNRLRLILQIVIRILDSTCTCRRYFIIGITICSKLSLSMTHTIFHPLTRHHIEHHCAVFSTLSPCKCSWWHLFFVIFFSFICGHGQCVKLNTVLLCCLPLVAIVSVFRGADTRQMQVEFRIGE